MARLNELLKIVKSLSQQEKAELIAFLSKSDNNNSSANCESGFNFIKQTSSCPHCKSTKIVKNGLRNSIQRFICKDCNKSFTVRTNTITEHSQKSFETWSKFIECMMNSFSVRRSAEICGINKDTAFIWRHKVLDALQNMQNSVELNGVVEADETFFALSFKGNHKKSTTFTMPRKAHKRGKDIHTRGLSHEQVCVPCGVNGTGLSVARISNLGRIGTKDLEFAFKNQIASDSILCCDGANAYRKFASKNSLDLIQLKSGKSKVGNFHIQHINAYHSNLKNWIKRFHGVATKYLNNYLVWNNFVNYAKESYKEKEQILTDFVFTTEKKVLCKNIPVRNPIPTKTNFVA